MILNVIVEEQSYPIRVSDEMITEGRGFFEKIDADMDRGWQMSRKWVDRPDDVQRCQIAADKILTAIETENEKLAALLAAYILQRLPNIDSVDIDISGDMTATELIMKEGS